MTDYRVIVAPEAFEDLNRILDFIKDHSAQNAKKTIERLWEATQSLNRFPHRFKVHLSNRKPSCVVRAMPVSPFVIYYRIIESPPVVRVLAVWHGARKQPRRFK